MNHVVKHGKGGKRKERPYALAPTKNAGKTFETPAMYANISLHIGCIPTCQQHTLILGYANFWLGQGGYACHAWP